MLGFLRVLVHTSYALYSNIEHEADNLGCLGENGASLHHIFVVKFRRCLVIMKLEHALNESEIVVLELKESCEHVYKVLLVVHLALSSLVGGTTVALLLYDASGIIEGTRSNEALLPSCSNDVQNKAVCWKLLAALDPEYVADLDVSPRYGNPSLDPTSDHQPLDLLAVDDVGHAPLTEFKG